MHFSTIWKLLLHSSEQNFQNLFPRAEIPLPLPFSSQKPLKYRCKKHQVFRTLMKQLFLLLSSFIFVCFQYDINPLQINVIETPVPVLHFLVRVCGVIGGIFATTGIVASLVSAIFAKCFDRFSEQKIPLFRQESHSNPSTPSDTVPANALFSHFPTDAEFAKIRSQ